MEHPHLINIAGLACPPGTAGELNRWYNEWHVPVNWQFAGLKQVVRYRLLGPANGGYPDFINVYWLADLAAFEAWNASPEMMESRKHREGLTGSGVEILWRVQYQSFKSWGDTSPDSVIRIEGGTAGSGPAEQPGLSASGLTGVTLYQLAGAGDHGVRMPTQIKVTEYPQFMTMYHFKDAASGSPLNSPSGLLWQVAYQPIKAWQR